MEQNDPLTGAASSLTDAATNGIRYWEPRRLLYNAVLAVVVTLHFLSDWPASRRALSVTLGLRVFVLAVMANVFYCAAYLPDVFAQHSTLRPAWLRSRWVVFLIGTAFAATLTHFISMNLFHPRGWQ